MPKTSQAAKPTPRKSTPQQAASPTTGRKTGRPPLEQNQARENWGVQMNPDLILKVRMRALERRCSPYDVLEEAVSTYFETPAKR
jgi:hypothetical protein